VVAGELTNRADNPTLFHRLQDYSVRTSWKQELKARLAKILMVGSIARSSSVSKRSTRKCCAAAFCRAAHACR
jgi:hypothetical protein